MKVKQKVKVIDILSPSLGRTGTIVSTATTAEVALASVKFGPKELAKWFHIHQLDLEP